MYKKSLCAATFIGYEESPPTLNFTYQERIRTRIYDSLIITSTIKKTYGAL